MRGLTDQQKKLLSFIAEYIASRGYAPTFREMASFLGCRINGVTCHLSALRKKGYIQREDTRARAIKVVSDGNGKPRKPIDATLEEELDFHRTRTLAFERLQKDMPEPWRTLVCNVLSYGSSVAPLR